jgi:polysaccharide export outer membrane protein
MKLIRVLCTLALSWGIHANAQNKPEPSKRTSTVRPPIIAPTLDNHHRLGSGDRVTFRVIEDQEEPKVLIVGDSGELQIPYIGLVRAADRTCRELAAEIKILLERDYYHSATVVLAVEAVNKTRTVGKVYVSGQVKNGGAQEIPADESFTVGKAILRAGGFSDFSDKKHVRVIRTVNGQTKSFVVNVVDVWEKGKTENDLVLQADDAIYVPERLVNF